MGHKSFSLWWTAIWLYILWEAQILLIPADQRKPGKQPLFCGIQCLYWVAFCLPLCKFAGGAGVGWGEEACEKRTACC